MSEEAIPIVTEEVSISKVWNMTYELIKRNLFVTFLVCCLIGLIIYYFVKVHPFKGSSFTHDHEHYHHHNHRQQIERQLMERQLLQQQAQIQQQPQMQQQENQNLPREDLLPKAFAKLDEISPEEVKEIIITRNETRQLPNQLIQNPLEQVNQPVKVLSDNSQDDNYDVINEDGMEIDIKARKQM